MVNCLGGALKLAYKIILHTSAYRGYVGMDAPIRITNAMMDRMNGLSFRESNLQEVEWRLRTLMNKEWFPSGVAFNIGFKFERWYGKNKKLNYMSVGGMDDLRICFPEFPNRCASDLELDKIKCELSENGVVTIPFSYFYSVEDYTSNLDGCFVEIIKCK